MKIPFDIKYRPQIESGEYMVETRDGRPARIICWDIEYYYPQYKIGALIKNDEGEDFFFLTEKGYFCIKESGECDSNNDLFIVTPEEELTEFEQEVSDIVEYCKKNGENVADGYAKRHAKTLLYFAEKELSTKYKFSSDLNGFAYGKGYKDGKKDALKDLPRWKKIGQGDNYSSKIKFYINGRYLEMNDTLNYLYEISLKDLDKLPKEDDE